MKCRERVLSAAKEEAYLRATAPLVRSVARVATLIAMHLPETPDGWIFSAPTKSGHIEQSSLKKQHVAALCGSGVTAFVIYDARHTCLTRWARTMHPFTLKKLAAHEDDRHAVASEELTWRARRGSNSRPNDSKSFALSN